MFTAEPVAEGTKDPTSGDRWARGCTAGGALTWQGTDAEPAARGEPGAPCCEPRTRRSRAEAARPSPARRPGQPGPDGLAAGGRFWGFRAFTGLCFFQCCHMPGAPLLFRPQAGRRTAWAAVRCAAVEMGGSATPPRTPRGRLGAHPGPWSSPSPSRTACSEHRALRAALTPVYTDYTQQHGPSAKGFALG